MMNRGMRFWQSPVRVVVLALLGLVLAATAGRAEWLVRKDGKRIETRGPADTDKGTVIYTDLSGATRTFPIEELDINATRLANLVARKRGTAPPVATEPHIVIDEKSVEHNDADLDETLTELELAPTWGARDAALRKLNTILERMGGRGMSYMRCRENYQNRADQAMCWMGNPLQATYLPGGNRQPWSVADLREAAQRFRCRRLHPRDAAAANVCASSGW